MQAVTRWLALLLLAACAAEPGGAVPAEGAVVPLQAEPVPVQAEPAPAQLRIAIIGDELASDAVEAIDLWSRATRGAFAPVVTVSDTCAGSNWCIYGVDQIPDEECADPTTNNIRRVAGGPRACSWGEQGQFQIELSRSTLAPEERVSAIAHEAGHGFWLVHKPGTGDLMDPDRPAAVRAAPCVSAEDVAEAGFVGPGTCDN